MEYKVIDWDGLTKTELEHVLNDLSVKGWRPILTQGSTIIILERPTPAVALFQGHMRRDFPRSVSIAGECVGSTIVSGDNNTV